MSNTLVVCNDCPYPANHGGRLDILQRIKLLIEIGERVDLVITHKEPIDKDSEIYLQKLCNNVYYIKRMSVHWSLVKSFINFIPLQMASREQLKCIKLENEYDNIICESEHVHAILENKSLKAKHKYLRIHNDEAVYFKGLGRDEAQFLKKIYYYYESHLFKVNEKKIKKQYDQLLYISNEEYDRAKQEYNAVWLPPYIPIEYEFNSEKFKKYKNRMLFVGNLFMPNNVNGVIWYLNNVHEKVLKTNNEVKLTIAGNAKNGISYELENAIKKHPADSINLVKSPSDGELIDLYNTHCIFINPMLNGAGVKLKNLDAMRHSFYIVSTTTGVEGTGVINNLNTMIADTPEEFSEALISHNRDVENIALSAFNHIKDNFDARTILKNIVWRACQ